MAELEDLACPFCGEPLFLDGLDVLWGENGALSDWAPCCLELREAIETQGWEAVFGRSLEESFTRFGCGEVREVYEADGLIRFRAELFAPGKGCPGWRDEAFRMINRYHRHHKAPIGWKFGVAAFNGRLMVGVAVVGRPVSRLLSQAEPDTLEVTRLCTWGDPRVRRNVSSMLYGCCAREAKKLGARKIITYTLESEDGASLKASNFTPVALTAGGSWHREARPRTDKAPTCRKVRWELTL